MSKLSISNIGWTKEQDQEVYYLMKKYGFSGLEMGKVYNITLIIPVTEVYYKRF